MSGPVTFRLRWEDPSILRRYAELSRHTPAEIVNRKLYFTARKAIWYTHKADIGKMQSELGEAKASELHLIKSGKRFSQAKSNIKSFFGIGAGNQGAPLLALIIQARVFGKGKQNKSLLVSPWKGNTRQRGAQMMLEAMRKVWNARARSIAFIKSGWIPARNILKALGYAGGSRGLPPSEGDRPGVGPKQIGRAKGGARPAENGIWKCSGQIWNTASAKHDHRDATWQYGLPALEKAFAEERQTTAEEVEKRLREHARACGIRAH